MYIALVDQQYIELEEVATLEESPTHEEHARSRVTAAPSPTLVESGELRPDF